MKRHLKFSFHRPNSPLSLNRKPEYTFCCKISSTFTYLTCTTPLLHATHCLLKVLSQQNQKLYFPIWLVDDWLDMASNIYNSTTTIKHISVVFLSWVKTSPIYYQGAVFLTKWLQSILKWLGYVRQLFHVYSLH